MYCKASLSLSLSHTRPPLMSSMEVFLNNWNYELKMTRHTVLTYEFLVCLGVHTYASLSACVLKLRDSSCWFPSWKFILLFMFDFRLSAFYIFTGNVKQFFERKMFYQKPNQTIFWSTTFKRCDVIKISYAWRRWTAARQKFGLKFSNQFDWTVFTRPLRKFDVWLQFAMAVLFPLLADVLKQHEFFALIFGVILGVRVYAAYILSARRSRKFQWNRNGNVPSSRITEEG